MLYAWANDKDTRQNSLSSRQVGEKEHYQWFAKIYGNQDHQPALICVKNGKARLGIIRFTFSPQKKLVWEIHFTIAPRFRGRGYAIPMLKKAIKWFRYHKANDTIFAQVKESNLKSLKALQSAGFKEQKMRKTKSGLITLRLPIREKLFLRLV